MLSIKFSDFVFLASLIAISDVSEGYLDDANHYEAGSVNNEQATNLLHCRFWAGTPPAEPVPDKALIKKIKEAGCKAFTSLHEHHTKALRIGEWENDATPIQAVGSWYPITGDGLFFQMRLIIDTDAGVDDGIAILNILGAEDLFGHIKVEFITTVAGNTHVSNVGKNVLKILKTAQRLDISVYRGANESILYTPKYDNYFGEDGFGDVDFLNPPTEDLIKGNAANALIEAVAVNPGQLTLVCLGPLTNIALATRLDPTFLSNLKDVFVLGGSDSGVGNIKPGVEFNIYVDPEAAFIVMKEAEKNKKILNVLTWETAYERSAVDMSWRKKILAAVNSRQVELINKAEEPTLKGDKWVCADCVLSAVVLDDEIVQDSAKYHIDVELCGQHSRGSFFIDYGRFQNLSENINLMRRINVDKFKKMLLQNLNPQNGLTNAAGRKV